MGSVPKSLSLKEIMSKKRRPTFLGLKKIPSVPQIERMPLRAAESCCSGSCVDHNQGDILG